MSCFQEALERFCDALGANINWHKSCGFWVGSGETPTWSPDTLFRWVPTGIPVRYLGCQVGLDLTAEQQVPPLLLSIKKKLLFWSTVHLSLAGRVVVANQVLLATMLLAWPVITLPTVLGGLGLVDLASQSRALLGKFIVRGMLPGGSPGKSCCCRALGYAGGLEQGAHGGRMRSDGFSHRCGTPAFLGGLRTGLHVVYCELGSCFAQLCCSGLQRVQKRCFGSHLCGTRW